jgi:hypothetical protein
MRLSFFFRQGIDLAGSRVSANDVGSLSK